VTPAFTRGDGEVGGILPTSPPPEEPVRSPERQRLHDAILNHRELTDALSRVSQALQRLRDELVEKYRPALYAAKERLEDAKADAPYRLTAELLDELPESNNPVAEAEAALAEAQRRVDEYHTSRQMLEEELANRERQMIWRSMTSTERSRRSSSPSQ
jgi:hypothetical protein